MKILLANPPYRLPIDNSTERFFIRAGSRWPFSIVKKINTPPEYLPFPFYLAYTASLLRQNPQIATFVRDSIALNETKKQFLKYIQQIKPDILFFETATGSFDYDIKLIQQIKKIVPRCIICLGGFHVTAMPQAILRQHGKLIDYLLLREYEQNFYSLVSCLKSGQLPTKIPGIAFKHQGKITINPNNRLTDVNQLPFPAVDLFPHHYWDGFCQLRPAIQMHSSRGCPFKCNFCVWNQLMYCNGRYRPRNVKSICDEMEIYIKKYAVREIYFDDDTFTGSQSHVFDLCREICRRSLHHQISWSAMADFMVTNTKMIRAMKKAGCIGLKFGVESGNSQILHHIGKPINFSRISQNVALCNKLKIKTHATFTFGLSGETKSTLQQTLDTAINLDCDSVQFSLTTPFPGTRYYRELQQQNLLTATDWRQFDGNHDSVIKFADFDHHYLVNLYNRSYSIWLRHKIIQPHWFARQIFFLFRSAQNQGLPFLFHRALRALDIIFR